MDDIRFSTFPDLKSTVSGNDYLDQWPETSWLLPELGLDHDLIVLSWGLFLRAYTGDISPTFLLDDLAVQVDIENLVYSSLQVDVQHFLKFKGRTRVLSPFSKVQSAWLQGCVLLLMFHRAHPFKHH